MSMLLLLNPLPPYDGHQGVTPRQSEDETHTPRSVEGSRKLFTASPSNRRGEVLVQAKDRFANERNLTLLLEEVLSTYFFQVKVR